MKCPKCQSRVDAGDKFCRACGHDLGQDGGLLSKDFGTPHSYTPKHLTDKILTTRSSIEGERKLVTVLFTDVVDYTAMAANLDPERVHQIMDGCFRILMDEIHRYEGTINQFTGDGLMALFGAPLAHEDHAQSACLAALGIQEALEGYGKDLKSKHGIDFKMRVGLNSGPVVVGSIGDDLRMDYTAIGDTTNLAFRIQSHADPGSILVSQNTYRMVKESLDFTFLGSVPLKGQEEPIELYKLKATRRVHRPRLGHERQIYSVMVGRDSELSRLELQVMKAVNGEGSIVNIIGEAGIGKSRLVAELSQREIMERVTLLEGRAISMGRNLSYHPFIDLLKQWAGIKEEDTEASAFDRMRLAIRKAQPQESDEVLCFVATLMGMKLSGRYAERVKGIEGDALETLLLKNLRSLLEKISESSPLVLVIEDLHWADTSSIELLEYLYRLTETHRVTFVNVFRPGYEETAERILQTTQERHPEHSIEIRLQPLDERTSETFIRNMLNITGLPGTVRQQIVERAGGNPFFIEEVVRSLIDEGAVVLKNDVFEVTNKIDAVVIPQTINAVVMARIDRLEEKTRDLVKVASVIGRSFFYRVLTEVARTAEDIDQRLGYLKEIQLVSERRRMEELEYLFKHALAQEAAYESILAEKRRELHLRVADSIERVFGDRLHEFYGMLAFHFAKAEEETKSEEYLIKAGEEALKSSASNEALRYYRQALRLYLDKHGGGANPATVAMLEKNIGVALYNKGQYLEATDFFDRVLEYYGITRPRNPISTARRFVVAFSAFLMALYFPFLRFRKIPTNKDREIIELLGKRSEALTDTDSKRFFIESFFFMERLSNFDLAQVENGVAFFAAASALFSYSGLSFRVSNTVLEFVQDKVDPDDPRSECYFKMLEVLHHYLAGTWDAATKYDEDLEHRALRVGQVYLVSGCAMFNGLLESDRGHFTEAQSLVDRMHKMADDYDNEMAKALAYDMHAYLLTKWKKVEEALPILEEAIRFANKPGHLLSRSHLHMFKARVQLLMGDLEGAGVSLSFAWKNLEAFEGLPMIFTALLIPQFILDLENLKEAITSGNRSNINTCRKKATRTGRRMVRKTRKVASDRTEALRLMGTYYWVNDRTEKALKWWRRSAKEGRRLGARVELSRTYFEIGKHLIGQEGKHTELDGISAAEYLQKARAMFNEMDLQWDLDELDRIIAAN